VCGKCLGDLLGSDGVDRRSGFVTPPRPSRDVVCCPRAPKGMPFGSYGDVLVDKLQVASMNGEPIWALEATHGWSTARVRARIAAALCVSPEMVRLADEHGQLLDNKDHIVSASLTSILVTK